MLAHTLISARPFMPFRGRFPLSAMALAMSTGIAPAMAQTPATGSGSLGTIEVRDDRLEAVVVAAEAVHREHDRAVVVGARRVVGPPVRVAAGDPDDLLADCDGLEEVAVRRRDAGLSDDHGPSLRRRSWRNARARPCTALELAG